MDPIPVFLDSLWGWMTNPYILVTFVALAGLRFMFMAWAISGDIVGNRATASPTTRAVVKQFRGSRYATPAKHHFFRASSYSTRAAGCLDDSPDAILKRWKDRHNEAKK